MSRSRSNVLPLYSRARAAITNDMFAGIDLRTKNGRRYRDLIAQFAHDTAGDTPLTEIEKILVKQAAAITIRMEALQLEIVTGTAAATADEDIVRLNNASARLLAQVVEARRPKQDRPGRPLSKDQKQSIAEHFRSRQKAKDAES